jgi:hypothetical protein
MIINPLSFILRWRAAERRNLLETGRQAPCSNDHQEYASLSLMSVSFHLMDFSHEP